jgi:hypothetical protein
MVGKGLVVDDPEPSAAFRQEYRDIYWKYCGQFRRKQGDPELLSIIDKRLKVVEEFGKILRISLEV